MFVHLRVDAHSGFLLECFCVSNIWYVTFTDTEQSKSILYPNIYVDLDQLVLFPTWPRVLLRSIRGFHRRRLQLDWTECNGAILEGSDGDGVGCGTRWVYLIINHGIVFDLFNSDEDSSKIPDVSIVEASAELLYGLVHQRYILTRAGLQAMVVIVGIRAKSTH